MANWCSNIMIYSGAKAPELFELFRNLKKESEEEGCGVLPKIEGINLQQGRYFFDLDIADNQNDFLQVRFDTKWVAPLEELLAIAKQYEGQYTIEVEEMGWLIFGKILINSEGAEVEHREVYLSDEVFEAIEETEDYTYRYKGVAYDSEFDILEQELNKLI